MKQPAEISFLIPKWIREYAGGAAPRMRAEERAEFVIEASRRNVLERTGGPFAAAMFVHATGELVALGTNLVTTQKLSILHAEIVALALAQRVFGDYNLGGADIPQLQLVASTEPCAMCLGAVIWSGIHALLSSATDADARAIGFDEGPKAPNWAEALASRGISVQLEIQRDEARRVLSLYEQMGGPIYNSRSAT